jgi:predicted nucleic-acid-binding protein
MTAVVDTSVLVRHFTHDDPVLGQRATQYLARAAANELMVTTVVFAEMVVVLERYYRQTRTEITQAVRSLISAPQVATEDSATLGRAADLYEGGSSFVDAYAVAVAEREECDIASFDRRIARRSTIKRIEP